jgi:hypothetical protein
MNSYGRNAARALSAAELEQVGGGCAAGANCGCDGTRQWTAGAGVFGSNVYNTDCNGNIYQNGQLYSRGNR